VIDPLRDIVGPAHVLTDPDVVDSYSVDWTGRFRGHTGAVVRPGSVGELAAVVTWCFENGVVVVPQGGNTGLVGGSVPLAGELVVSLRRLVAITDIDPVAGQLTAGAGATLAAVHAAAATAGWSYAIDLSARDSATIGGTVATNAGGLHVLRYGDTRAQLIGAEAVLGDGSVVSHLGGLLKDNTGYHLASLLCGSEGTLGIITAARLRLVPRLALRVVALLGLASMDAAVELAGRLRLALPDLEALEFFSHSCFELLGLPRPHDARHDTYVLVECAGVDDPTASLADAVGDLPAAVAGPDESARRAELWRYREGITEAINRLGPPHKLDVTLPAGAMAQFCARVATVLPVGAQVWLFGHLGDGNVHVNVTGVAPDADDIDEAVFELVAAHGGSISAEHGIGTAKKRWIHLNRSASELTAMRAIKAALDPAGILNPNVLLP
jgi:FAD/FMN-containing dehydrogenase